MVADRCTRLMFTVYHELLAVKPHPLAVVASFKHTGRNQTVTLESFAGRYSVLISQNQADDLLVQMFELYFRGSFEGKPTLVVAGLMTPERGTE